MGPRTASGTYISKLVVPEVGLVAFEQLNGQIAVLPVALLYTHTHTRSARHVMQQEQGSTWFYVVPAASLHKLNNKHLESKENIQI